MPDWHRRAVLATGAALSTTGVLASIDSTTAEDETASSSASTDDSVGWSSAGGNAANSRYLPLAGEFPKPDTVAWRHELSHAVSHADGQVAVADGRVYVLTDTDGDGFRGYETELRALDADDGTVDWRIEVEARHRPTIADETVYVAGEDRVTAYDAVDGSGQWNREFETDEWVSSPTAAAGAVYVVAGGTLYALDASDGSTRWRRDRIAVRPERERAGDSVPTSFSEAAVAVADGTVYAVTDGAEFDATDSDAFASPGGVAALDATSGDDQWGIALEDGAAGDPIATDAFVFVLHAPGDTARGPVLDPETGEPVEESAITTAGTPDARVSQDVSFPGTGTLDVTASDDGTCWSAPEISFHGPLIAGDTLIAVHGDGSVIGFDLGTGAENWRSEFDSQPSGLTAVDEDTLYARFDDELVALRASDGESDDTGDDTDSDC